MNDSDKIYQDVQNQVNKLLFHLREATKNIIWTAEIEVSKWDCHVKIKGDYLIYHSLVYSPILELDKAITDNEYISKRLEYFGDYVVRTTIQNLSRAMFEVK